MDGGAWKSAVHGVAESRTRLSDFLFAFHFHALEKEMATHFSVLAWRIPETVEPGGLPSMGSHRVGHDWSILAAAAAASVMRFRNGWLETIPSVNSSPHMNSTCLLIPGLTRWAIYSARGFHSLSSCHLFCRSHLDDRLVLLISAGLLNRGEVGEHWAEPVWSPRCYRGTT